MATTRDPERTRQALLDCALRLALERGLAGLSLQQVARAAGVTKGGLFHHFASRDALLEAMARDFLDRLDAEIDARLAADPAREGRFTRAYVAAMLGGEVLGEAAPFAAPALAMLAEPGLREVWSGWIAGRLARHADTDGGTRLAMIRLAADGAWLAHVTDASQGPSARESLAELLRMSSPG
ncbi:TetR/AcrR family transcriptional regulator [Limimaricola pyoseonensis]|uniref:Regulatory protein, tetR family n=1 Tax=Limimaricola pyoseonensis TaxID=521013 RepID=A0A1G7J628_9RHOB|nr:TetR/AcrR family transcriptional regulator [Limimaricola pyoseonensis]SDF20325.1 regulatory protein, tetR family [Limimaricola pyoseonensis]